MTSSIISIIYSTLYFVLSAAMFLVLIPQKEEYSDYKKARQTMGTAFLLIGLFGLYRSFVTLQPPKGYLIFCIICILCVVFATLNFIGFLYITETSNAHIRKVFKAACIGCGIIVIGSVIGFISEDFQTTAKIINNAVYGLVCCYFFRHSLIEYKKCRERLSSYYSDNSWDIMWMYKLLWLTFIMAIAMIVAFWIREIRIYIGFLSMLFYAYMTFKVLGFVPATIDKVRHDTSLAETEEEEQRIEESRTPSGKTLSDYSRKIEPMLQEWVESGHYTRPAITIKEVAAEIGTNHNYLSTYLNKIKETSFTTWLNTLRIEKSMEYLSSEKRYSIEECGVMVGIPESYNYSRWFKIVTGMSPIAYKKSLKLK